MTTLLSAPVMLFASLGVGCGGVANPPQRNIFSDPDDRLHFEACESRGHTDANVGSAVDGRRLAVGSVVDQRPFGDTLYFFEKTSEELDISFDLIALLHGDLFVVDTVEVTRFIPVVARPPMARVLLTDMQRLLEERLIDSDRATHDQAPLSVDLKLVETRTVDLPNPNPFSFRGKIEGRVSIEVLVREVETDSALYTHSIVAADTIVKTFAGKRHYRRALSNAYCHALDMIATALDSLSLANP
ncbi:MAG: hypothetical protein GWN32_00730 [Gemmatimonadetes bacterium]|nr:hypothetical protein [Gemmatimonadota bacterium]